MTLYRLQWLLLALLTTLLCLIAPVAGREVPAQLSESPQPSLAQGPPQTPEQQAQQLYEAGDYQAAIDRLHQIVQASATAPLRQAVALGNLALAQRQLGNWAAANQAIDESVALLQALESAGSTDPQVFGQVLNIQGELQLAQGQPQTALQSWQQAARWFEQTDDLAAIAQMQIHQAQALQALGLYRQAISQLDQLNQHLQNQPDTALKATTLRSLADALIVAGNLPLAQELLEQSLQIVQQLPATPATQNAIAATQLSLGNLGRAEAIATLNRYNLTLAQVGNRPTTAPLSLTGQSARQQQTAALQTFDQQVQTALDRYQQAVNAAVDAETQTQAQLNQLRLLVDTQQQAQAQALYPQIQTRLKSLPAGHSRIYKQLDLAQSLVLLNRYSEQTVPTSTDIAEHLTAAYAQAQASGDRRAQSYALGSLGELYEHSEQRQEARSLTEQALGLAQSIEATDIAYRWQWQLGRLLKANGDRTGAIAAYQEAVTSLQTLRNDLVAVNRDVQFSFREQIEPVYRELVDLLLRPEPNSDQTIDSISEPNLTALVQARDVIEGLQIAELDNFFREACLDTEFQLDRVVDQEQLSAAILYTIVLPDRLDVILKLPQQPLLHYATDVSQQTVETTIDQLLVELRRPFVSRPLTTLLEQVYGWLIRPAEATLQTNGVETLVFVLDGALRSLPMAALYDGQRYLLESYSVAIAPGLQLPDPKPLQAQDLQALVLGLSEARNNFPPLTYVAEEIAQIQTDVPSQVLFNQRFTRDNFRSAIGSQPFAIVHIATHGQFSSNAAETFILAWDEPIDVNELSTLLQTQALVRPDPIELLVLSACQTAVGDRRATLGLAGVAVRAGARSTIASLWNLDDDSGAVLMRQFYQALVQPISKAEALRQAQLALLNDPQYQAPRFWAPYVLLGNWL
jgi:CHAT domain-containing protein